MKHVQCSYSKSAVGKVNIQKPLIFLPLMSGLCSSSQYFSTPVIRSPSPPRFFHSNAAGWFRLWSLGGRGYFFVVYRARHGALNLGYISQVLQPYTQILWRDPSEAHGCRRLVIGTVSFPIPCSEVQCFLLAPCPILRSHLFSNEITGPVPFKARLKTRKPNYSWVLPVSFYHTGFQSIH